MAETQNVQGPRLARSESLQKMLDLEKQFKLARFQAQIVTPSPIQARRRHSREPLALQSQQHPDTPARRSGPVSPLSISIPTPSPATSAPENSNDGNGEADYDDSNDAMSEQSSICQSPSWEGYGRKKKEKKMKQEAGQQRREKSKASQDTRPSTRKKATNRLFKTLPTESADTASDHAQIPSSTSARPAIGNADTKAGRTTPSGHRSLIPDMWCVAMGSGLSGQMTQPPYARSASSLGAAGLQDKPAGERRENNASKSKVKGKNPDSNGTNEKAYPPLSSRSHALRHSLLPVHIRQKSATSLSSGGAGLGLMMEDHTRTPKDNYLYATKNLSDQSVDYAAEPKVTRGRQRIDPMLTSNSTSTSTASTTGSYVRQARAQSIEKSIKGLMQEAALSDPNLLNAPNRMAFSYIGPKKDNNDGNGKQENHQDGDHRPSTSQFNTTLEKDKEVSAEKTIETEKQRNKYNNINNNDTDPSNSDYFTLVTNHCSPANLDSGTPSSGILSSIKSRISRHSSISSGSTSHTGKSFRERAFGAIHLQSTTASAVPNGIDLAPLPSRKPSQILQTNALAAAACENNKTTPTLAKAEQIPALVKEGRLLPKAARILGEINQQTMSQGTAFHGRPSEGSPASSYHEDSSVPPSPASTPDTSRPQSTKDAAVSIGIVRVDNANEAAKAHSTETLSATSEKSLAEGLGVLDEAWSQSTVAPDNDAQSFVTTLTNQKSATSLRSQTGILSLKEAALLTEHNFGMHPALKDLKDEDGIKRRRVIPKPTTVINEELPKESLRSTAAYSLTQGARRSAPMISSPLTKVIRSSKAMPLIATIPDAASANVDKPDVPTSPTHTPAHEPETQQMQVKSQTQIQTQLPSAPPKQPLAKMLVECCHCKFFHDMPSRVYECMAQPDAVVTDSELGVSGAITTMVKCPWCAHNMSTACCAGYAAVVYLKERLH